MKYEFKHNGTTKLVLNPTNSVEEALMAELFGGETTIEVTPDGKEITISKVKKPQTTEQPIT
jgi:hypothetical protein